MKPNHLKENEENKWTLSAGKEVWAGKCFAIAVKSSRVLGQNENSKIFHYKQGAKPNKWGFREETAISICQ